MAIIDFFDRGWRGNPQGVAYIQDDRHYSFSEVGELSCRVAHALLAEGFGRETKGAVWAGNDVKAWTCTLGRAIGLGCSGPTAAARPRSSNSWPARWSQTQDASSMRRA